MRLEELKKHPRLNGDPTTREAAEEITWKRAACEYDKSRLFARTMSRWLRGGTGVIAGRKSPSGERPKNWEEFPCSGW